jgi:hypothetical protein
MRILFFVLLPVFCFCQKDNYCKFNKLPKSEFVKAANDSIEKLNSGENQLLETLEKLNIKVI